MFERVFCSEIKLIGYSFHVFNAIQEFALIDTSILQFADLKSNFIVGDRAVYVS